jgi:hypothetical protein
MFAKKMFFVCIIFALLFTGCARPVYDLNGGEDEDEDDGWVIDCNRIAPTTYLLEDIQNYFILTGLKNDVLALTDILELERVPRDEGGGYFKIMTEGEGYIGPYPDADSSDNPLISGLVRTNEFADSNLEGTKKQVSVLATRYGKMNSQAPPKLAFLDPNYLTDLPHSVGAHPFGDPVVVGEDVQIAAQWAFTEPISIPHGLSPLRPVAIFDTSPYTPDGDKPYSVATTTTTNTITVTSYLSNPGSSSDYLDSHGLFVASIIHAVSPSAKIDLVQVLDEKGQGDLFTLLRAINCYMENNTDSPVINLSQGISNTIKRSDLGYDEAVKFEEALTYFFDSLNSSNASQAFGQTEIAMCDFPIVALGAVLNSAVSRGATIVAAAGNSKGSEGKELPAYPAAYPFVMDVASTNTDGELSCFSHYGQYKMPGGESCVGEVELDPEEALNQCNDSGNCLYAITGLIFDSESDDNQKYQYAYWMGASFAAPFMTGLCAAREKDYCPE